jgi:histone deacetylase HOS3
MAYVCLGERHAEGEFPPHPKRDPSELPSVPFKIRKTTRRLPFSSQAVTNVHGIKWMEELKIMCDNAESRLAMNGKELARPDIHRGTAEEPAQLHEGDLYLCSESLNAMEGALGAVCEGVDAVFQGSASGKGPHHTFVAIRPPGHHCSASYPSGFCWVNNVHVGISHAALTHGLTHAAIIDFDLHHGDGSQAIAWENNKRAASAAKNALPWKKTSIGYFSLHDINSYPCEMGDEEKVKNASLCIENAHGQSIWNVHLQPWKSDIEFWDLYETKYSILLEKARNYLRAQTSRLRLSTNGPKPKGAIFLSAGFDASEWEGAGMQRHKVNVPTEFYARLTRDVVKLAAEEGTGVDGRVISVLEGGYSDRALCTGVLSHLSGMTAGDAVVIKKELSPNGLGYEMGQKIGAFDGIQKRESVTMGNVSYDPSWWSVQRLEQLDAVVRPPPATDAKKPRDPTIPTYSSPTQSFIAKVTSPVARRNVSNMSNMNNGSPSAYSRPPSPAPPEVDWTVAAHELSKLLIPTDRQTMSCQPEELSVEASRKKQSTVSPILPETENNKLGMALRIRKASKSYIETVDEHELKRPATRNDRRKTVAGPTLIVAEKVCPFRSSKTFSCLTGLQAISRSNTPIPVPVSNYTRPGPSNRRSSIASTTDSVVPEAQGLAGRGRVVSHRLSSISQRPETSQSVRPDSPASVRGGAIPPLAVKKVRQPAQPRAEAAKFSRARKSAPKDSVPTADKPANQNTAQVTPANKSASAEPNSIDNLNEVFSKVTLDSTQQDLQANKNSKPTPSMVQLTKDLANLNTGDDKHQLPVEKKQLRRVVKSEPQEPLEKKVKQVTKSEPTKKPLIVKIKNGRFEKPSEHFSPVEPASAVNQPSSANLNEPDTLAAAPSTPEPSLPTNLQTEVVNPMDIALPASSPPSSSSAQVQSTESSSRPSTTSDEFIHYQAEGPTPKALTPQKNLQWLAPNTTTPSPMKRGGPHGFTKNSVIPFANSSNEVAVKTGVKTEESNKEVEIYEVPETPQ